MLNLILGVYFLIGSALAQGQTAGTDPSTLYTQGKFQEALQALQTAGLNTTAQYYNAGNCLYRLGKLGQALAYFEKARTLSPENEDIRYNVELTRTQLEKSGALAKDNSFWLGFAVPWARQIPETAVLLLFTFLSGLLAWVTWGIRKTAKTPGEALLNPLLLGVLALWLTLGAGVGGIAIARATKLAIVVADAASARSGPADSYTELFHLNAGSTVELTGEARQDWLQVRFSLGNVGWIVERELLAL